MMRTGEILSTISIKKRIPCKYSVARYVADEVRDEPINLGIVLQSNKISDKNCRFITRFSKIRTATEEPTFLKKVIEKIRNDVASSEKADLNEVVSKYHGKIIFTKPRTTLAEDLDKQADWLFERFVSIEKQSLEDTHPITIRHVKKNIWNYLQHFDKPVQRNYLITGKNSKFIYHFFIDESKQRIFHSISFDAVNAIKNTKLFDWSVRDVMEVNGYKQDNFGAIILEPQENNPRYPKLKEKFREGLKILKSRKYDLVTFDEENRWKKEIKELVS